MQYKLSVFFNLPDGEQASIKNIPAANAPAFAKVLSFLFIFQYKIYKIS
jgi:hypothetical protein